MKPTQALVLILLLGAFSCHQPTRNARKPQTSQGKMTPAPSPPITKATRTHYNQAVTVQGVYRELNVSKRPGKPVFSRRVYLELDDKTSVVLETHDNGVRPASEISQFKDKKVAVKGTLQERKQIWGQPYEASIFSDCLVNIKSIALVP